MKELKGVIVGLGYFSQFHLEAWLRLEQVEITAICDRNIELAKRIAKNLGIAAAYRDFDSMLVKETPDFVDIITPPETHKKLCLEAAKKGIHVICQKPLAPSLNEAEEIKTAVLRNGVRMMVHENFRFQPWHREIKKLLDQNAIGIRLHNIHWRMRMGDGWQEDAYMKRQPYFREMRELLMYETGIHFIDLFRYYFGEVSKVYAVLDRLNDNIKGEDFGWVQFQFENGTHGFLDANRYNESTCKNPRLTFGAMVIEGNKGSIRLHEDGRITVKRLGKPEVTHDYTFKDKNFSGDCVYNTQQHFIAQLNSGKPFETDVQEYLVNIRVLEKVYQSNEKKLPLVV